MSACEPQRSFEKDYNEVLKTNTKSKECLSCSIRLQQGSMQKGEHQIQLEMGSNGGIKDACDELESY